MGFLLVIGIIISLFGFGYLLKKFSKKKESSLDDADIVITKHGDHTDVEIHLESSDCGPGPDISELVETALMKIKSPDANKPFAKLSGNTIGTSTETEKPKDKPKRTYKKREPKPKDTPKA